MTLTQRAAAYAAAFQKFPASHLRVVTERGGSCLYGTWLLGNDYSHRRCRCNEQGKSASRSYLPRLRHEETHTSSVVEKVNGPGHLFSALQRSSEGTELGETRAQRPCGVETRIRGEAPSGDSRRLERPLDRRSSASERRLHRTATARSSTVQIDGLCPRAHRCGGDDARSAACSCGSCAPLQSEPVGQSGSEPACLQLPQRPYFVRTHDRGEVCNSCGRSRAYYGAYPPTYLSRVRALFPDIDSTGPTNGQVNLRILHVFSGSLPPGPYLRCDTVQPAEIKRSVYDLDANANGTYELIYADPPYSAADAEKYGTPMVDRRRALAGLARVTRVGGFVVWLDTVWPQHRKEQFRTVGRIALVRSTNHRVRLVSIFERQASA